MFFVKKREGASFSFCNNTIPVQTSRYKKEFSMKTERYFLIRLRFYRLVETMRGACGITRTPTRAVKTAKTVNALTEG